MSTSSAAVLVTGMGVVSPAGCTLSDFWSALLAGRSMARPLDDATFAQHRVRIGCPVRGLETIPGLDEKQSRRTDPFARYAVAAARAALSDAGDPTVDDARAAVVVGNAVGGRWTSDQQSRAYVDGGPSRVHPLMPLMTMPNAAAALIGMHLGWHGPTLTIANTCASGADAIGLGTGLLREGRADIVLAGGCEATLTPVTMAAFANLNALSERADPGTACRPFDRDRDGLVMGEGAGFVVLEREADAQARGARTYGRIAGYAATSDAYHLSMPHPGGLGAEAAMLGALRSSGWAAADITHVNAHGTSTPHNDRVEAATIRAAFGSADPPVTSTKGVIGHLIGAAGAVEIIATLLAQRAGLVPPTANHQRLDDEMEIDVVADAPRPIRSGPALSNSFGFGGHNACVVVAP